MDIGVIGAAPVEAALHPLSPPLGWAQAEPTAGDGVTRRSLNADFPIARQRGEVIEISILGCGVRARRLLKVMPARKTARRVGRLSMPTRVTLVAPDSHQSTRKEDVSAQTCIQTH